MKKIYLIGCLIMVISLSGITEGNSLLNEYPRTEIYLNGQWQWLAGYAPHFTPDTPSARVPGAYQYDDMTLETCSWYHKIIFLPESLKDTNARWYINLQKTGWYTKVLVNGVEVGENYGSILPFEFDVTDQLKWGEQNDLKIFVHIADMQHTLPGVEIKETYEAVGFRAGGRFNRNWAQIEGDVKLCKKPIDHIDWHRVETSVRNKEVLIKGSVKIASDGNSKPKEVKASVFDLDRDEEVFHVMIPLKKTGDKGVLAFSKAVDWQDPVLWGFGEYGKPYLYGLRLELVDNKSQNDAITSRFGFREVWYQGRKLMFNNKELFISASTIPHGFTREASYLYPYGMFERNQMMRYMQLLRKFGWNGIHNHFDTLGDSIYDVADELGFLVVAGAYCTGPGWLTPSTGLHSQWPEYMHDAISTWAKDAGNHTSVVMWSPVCGVPQDNSGKAHSALDVAGAVRDSDATRSIIGADVDYIKHSVEMIRKKANSHFKDSDNRPRFIKEVWALNANEDLAVKSADGMVKFFKDNEISGFVSFGETFPLFDFQVSWPSESGPDIRWGKRFSSFAFKGWLNWCDTTKPIHMPSSVAVQIKKECQSPHANDGDDDMLVYPHILSSGHSRNAEYLAIESMKKLKPNPRIVLLDNDFTGYINVLYPGQNRLHEIGKKNIRTKEIAADKKILPFKPGYFNLVEVSWDQ